jgi:galactokinase/mevalonate kinase-like predicted kinase
VHPGGAAFTNGKQRDRERERETSIMFSKENRESEKVLEMQKAAVKRRDRRSASETEELSS